MRSVGRFEGSGGLFSKRQDKAFERAYGSSVETALMLRDLQQAGEMINSLTADDPCQLLLNDVAALVECMSVVVDTLSELASRSPGAALENQRADPRDQGECRDRDSDPGAHQRAPAGRRALGASRESPE